MSALLISQIPKISTKSAGAVPFLIDAARQYKIEDPMELAHWLGQMHVESAGFTVTTESLNYSVEGLLATFSRARLPRVQAEALGRKPGRPAQQQAIANVVYGGVWGRKNLGNTQPNDGWYFRGRGYKQTTGRHNYLAASMGLFGDQTLMLKPELLSDPKYAALSAAYFWVSNSLGPIAQRDYNEELAEVARDVTKKVNGGVNGLQERTGWTYRYKRLFGLTDN